MCAGRKKKNTIYTARAFSRASSLLWKTVSPALSTLPCGCWAAGWLFDEGAELKQREMERERKNTINLAESDRASANTSTLNRLSHPPLPLRRLKKKKKKGKQPSVRRPLQLEPHFTPCCVFSGQPVPSHAPVPLQPICSAPLQDKKINEAF